jgi:tRNA/rRNA methyltransferase
LRIRFVLVGIEGSINLGMIARTCKNFLIDELYIVDPKADLGEAYIYAAKAKDYLSSARIVHSLDEAVEGSQLVVATSAKGYGVGDVLRQAISITGFIELVKDFNGLLTIMFGRESTGLTREELSRADYLVSIPANPEYPVLNISQAAAVIAWELWKIRGLGASARNVPRRASREKIDELLGILNTISERIFSTRDKIERVMRIWRNVINRAYPSEYEIRLLTYWSRRVLSKIDSSVDK